MCVIGITQVEAAELVGQQPGWWKMAVRLFGQYLIDIPWRLKDKFHRRLATGCAGVARLRASLLDRDIPLWLNTTMDQQVQDEEGRVIGLEVTREGKKLDVDAGDQGIVFDYAAEDDSEGLRGEDLRCS